MVTQHSTAKGAVRMLCTSGTEKQKQPGFYVDPGDDVLQITE